MHVLYSYLITGLIMACLNDIFVLDELIEQQHPNLKWYQKLLDRTIVAVIITIGWLPYTIYTLFFVKGSNQ